jgi:hypothetical protein
MEQTHFVLPCINLKAENLHWTRFQSDPAKFQKTPASESATYVLTAPRTLVAAPTPCLRASVVRSPYCGPQNSKSFNRLSPIFNGTQPIRPEKTVKPMTLAKTKI